MLRVRGALALVLVVVRRVRVDEVVVLLDRRRRAHGRTRQLGLEMDGPFLVHKPEDFEGAFASMTERRAQAAIVASSSITFAHRHRVARAALKYRLPVMAAFRELPQAGMLMSYGPNIAAIYHRAASYADKVLKGTPPGEIPVEQPTKYDLVINLKTAGALGLTIPPTLLARADEVIE